MKDIVARHKIWNETTVEPRIVDTSLFVVTSALRILFSWPGCEITKNYLVSFRKLNPKIWVSESLSGFPSGSQIHLESLALIFTGCPFGNPCKIIGFPAVFLGVPDIRKLSNFAPCWPVEFFL